MKKLLLICLLAITLFGCQPEDTAPEIIKNYKLTYVYKAEGTEKLNLYYFYTDKGLDTGVVKEIRADLNDSGVAVFTLPKGMHATQKITDSLSVNLSSMELAGSAYITSAVNKGKIKTVKNDVYINGKPAVNEQFYSYIYTDEMLLKEYKNGNLLQQRWVSFELRILK